MTVKKSFVANINRFCSSRARACVCMYVCVCVFVFVFVHPRFSRILCLDIIFTSVSTASSTHPGTRQGDTDGTIDLALVSPKLTPWMRAETLASHGSDHRPVVYRKQGLSQDGNHNISVQVR